MHCSLGLWGSIVYFSYIEAEAKPIEKKKLSEKIKEKENLQRKKQEELRKQVSSDMAVFFFFFSVKSYV